jgi:FixJ family two-component response regulator
VVVRGSTQEHIFVVDDDECIRTAAAAMLEAAGYTCTVFADGDHCLKQLDQKVNPRACDLLITDVRMPGKDGIVVLTEALRRAPWLPVIVMTSYADVPLSVKALKAGACDFIEKPLESGPLLSAVRLALSRNEWDRPLLGKSLTKTERIVLRLILQGMGNRRISYVLQRSERTIEVHRASVMKKFGVDNIVDLVKTATAMGLCDRPTE